MASIALAFILLARAHSAVAAGQTDRIVFRPEAFGGGEASSRRWDDNGSGRIVFAAIEEAGAKTPRPPSFGGGAGGGDLNDGNRGTVRAVPEGTAAEVPRESAFGGKKPEVGVGSESRRLLPEESCGVDLPRRIMGGRDADIDEFPWVALLLYRDAAGRRSADCSGALISARYVLTAAHCTAGLGVVARKLTLEKVRLGEWDVSTRKDCQQEVCSKPHQDIEVEEALNHEGYDPRAKAQADDIALLRLRREADFNEFVQPICLPPEEFGDEVLDGRRLVVSGWGKTDNAPGSKSSIKRKVELPAVAWENCRDFYRSFYGDVEIRDNQMCAGGEEGRDSCQGDSGGPLMAANQVRQEFRWFVVGIVSSGPAACGVEGRPSLYTRVSSFRRWILDNIRD